MQSARAATLIRIASRASRARIASRASRARIASRASRACIASRAPHTLAPLASGRRLCCAWRMRIKKAHIVAQGAWHSHKSEARRERRRARPCRSKTTRVVDPTQNTNRTRDSNTKTRWTRPYSIIILYDERPELLFMENSKSHQNHTTGTSHDLE